MATRKWFANDGQTHFDTKAEAVAHDGRFDMERRVAEIANRSPGEILKWFEENFRVPKTRATGPRKPRTPKPGDVPPVPSASAMAAQSDTYPQTTLDSLNKKGRV